MILTWLYVPGDRPEVVAKALHSGADAVIVDLEDAVSASRKEYARAATAERLAERPPVPVFVRVNALDSPWAGADLTALTGLHGLAGLRLPKITAPEQIAAVADRTGGVALHAMLESALGVERAYEIARAHPVLRGLSLGEADLGADLGISAESGLDWPRSRVVIAARAAGLAPPAQSVFPDIRDLEALAVSCVRGRALGLLGRAAIHPRQLPVIERAYLPGPAEVTAAEEIVAAARRTPGAVALPDGRFVDPAVLAGAERVVALARRESPVLS
ncbi:HpcH/HpaI aldolase/citrate lyase family protein [Streptomyces sp. NBC_01006]|uniref:HpcH/HpaI aldolase/citrate lyase family protein n=1 Tax=Streptomyces sp. NBC_01006 TaxID=2903716 RepID=UPI003867463F|nr:CoA ester lyase [Streptomyces sp. NBC_01006]